MTGVAPMVMAMVMAAMLAVKMKMVMAARGRSAEGRRGTRVPPGPWQKGGVFEYEPGRLLSLCIECPPSGESAMAGFDAEG